MDAKKFGCFLAETRRAQGLTQSELAEQLHVTDKAVSRWERGLGFPDINTLEPLAGALGITLTQLMHADSGDFRLESPCRGTDDTPTTLEEFFRMISPSPTAWQSVRWSLFCFSIAVAVFAQFTLPVQVHVHWQLLADGTAVPDKTMPLLSVYLRYVARAFLSLLVWKTGEHSLFSQSAFTWHRSFHPRLIFWIELFWHLICMGMTLGCLFMECMILFLN